MRAAVSVLLAMLVGACATDDGSSPQGGPGSSSGAITPATSGSTTAPDSSSSPSAGSDPGPASTGPIDPGSGTTTAVAESSGSSGALGCTPYTPWFYDGFDGYPVGRGLSGGPFDAAGRTVASDAEAFAGGQSARMEIRPEDGGGFGQWGAILPLPDIPAGESIWVRLWVRWPSDFEFSAGPWMKFLRLHNRRSDGSNGGYNDLYVDNADGPDSVLRSIKEVHDIWEVYDGEPLPRDQWERYEVQLVVDDRSVDDGGEARFRVWRDDALIFDRTDVPTITDEGGTIDGLYIFTYWNNEMPPNNVAYIDELAVAFGDTPPPQLDAQGLPYFGDWLPCPR